MRIPVLFLLSLLILSPYKSYSDPITIYYRQPHSAFDNRQNFVKEVIKALMDSTVKSHGPYIMKPLPKMVYERIAIRDTQKLYPNLVIRISGNKRSLSQFLPIKIPVNRGIVGYRIFLIRKNYQSIFSNIRSFKQLKSSNLKAGQGYWNDATILENNGLKVVRGINYEGLFKMLMNKRFDYFPRGVNEAFDELDTRKHLFPGMAVEKTIAFYYPLPRLLATSIGNKTLALRIEKGLKRIFSNGVHRKIWIKYNKKWIEKADLKNRRIFRIENKTAIPDLPYHRKEYWFSPEEKL